jgi:hypothetical protein
MWESREQEEFAREVFRLLRYVVCELASLHDKVASLERKVDDVATNVLISQQSLQDLFSADQALDAQVIAVLDYLATITSNPTNDTAQLENIVSDVNTRVSALAAGLKAAQGAGAVTLTLTADPTSISAGGSSTLTAVATNGTAPVVVIVTGSDGSSFNMSATGGTQAVSPTTTTTYTATDGTVTATATVTVA